jgi:metal-dependent hydrolase (beta-lactamase superfamily II)
VGNLRRAGYTPEEVDVVLVTHLHSDHIGGLTTRDENRVFPNLRREGRKRLLAVTGNRGQPEFLIIN